MRASAQRKAHRECAVRRIVETKDATRYSITTTGTHARGQGVGAAGRNAYEWKQVGLELAVGPVSPFLSLSRSPFSMPVI